MKITKLTKQSKELLESKLIESEDVLDPEDSVSELADDIIDSTEDATEGEVTLSDADATKIASEIKKVDDEIDLSGAAVDAGDTEFLGVKNKITETLDVALQTSRTNKRRGAKFGANVLIIGLPGSGKTASIYDWAHANGINLVSVNAKNNDLDAFINGYTTKDPDNGRRVIQAYSSNLDDLDKPNSVLFLDEYNRQVKPQIRASLLTLINEHKIVGEGPNKQHEFKNMLFTIAAINPAVSTDRGAAALNDAEKTRFLFKLKDMDSDPATTIDFLYKFYNKQISKLDPSSEYYREDLEDYLRTQDLGIFLVSHPKFATSGYDTKEDLETLALEDATMLNQRSLTEGLDASRGNVEVFKRWVEYSSDFLKSKVELILGILREYVVPTFEELCAGRGIDSAAITAATTKIPDELEVSSDIEDDDDFFASSAKKGTIRAKNPAEAEMAIKSEIESW